MRKPLDIDWNATERTVFIALHTCTICRKEGLWGDTWTWYGSQNQIDHDQTEPIVVMCSVQCRQEWHDRNAWRFKA